MERVIKICNWHRTFVFLWWYRDGILYNKHDYRGVNDATSSLDAKVPSVHVEEWQLDLEQCEI